MSISDKVKRIASTVGNYFVGIFKGVIGQAGESLETATIEFVKTDVGQAALAGVEYASTLAGKSNDELRDAAKAHMLDVLKQTGKDLLVIAESQLNLFIELAYAAWKAHALGL